MGKQTHSLNNRFHKVEGLHDNMPFASVLQCAVSNNNLTFTTMNELGFWLLPD